MNQTILAISNKHNLEKLNLKIELLTNPTLLLIRFLHLVFIQILVILKIKQQYQIAEQQNAFIEQRKSKIIHQRTIAVEQIDFTVDRAAIAVKQITVTIQQTTNAVLPTSFTVEQITFAVE